MITLTPAFGRDYKNVNVIKKDFFDGKDFIINQLGHPYDGKPANKYDLMRETGTVQIRYGGLRKVVVVNF